MVPLAVLGLGPGEWILILLVLVIVFGVGRLPQIGRSLGKGLQNFRKGLKGEDEGEEEKKDENEEKPPQG